MTNNPQPMQILQLLTSANASTSKTIDRSLSVHGLSYTEFQVMHHLHNAPQQVMSRIALAEATHLTASGITRLLNPMEKNHWVSKEKNSRDARVSLVKLTSSGLSLYQDALTTCNSVSETLCQNLSARQLASLAELLSKIQ